MYAVEILAVGSISNRDADTMSVVLVGVGSFVGVFQVFCLFYCLLCERLFLG